MESQLSEESLRAAALAARLRTLQANFADDDAATRQTYLVEEIERAVKGCVPDKRRALLDALAVKFPSWLISGPVPASDAAPPALPTPGTPEELLDQLLAILPKLTDPQRAVFTEKMKAAGLIPEPAAAGPGIELPAELQKRLGIPAGQSFGAERAGKTLALLLDMVLTMDQLVWTLWKQLAAKSSLRREADLGKMSAEYLTGSQEISTAQMMQALERTRKMVAGLLGAVGRVGGTFARERSRLFDPGAIEADARSEKKWNESLEFACWRKYVQLCKEYGAEPVIEKGIHEAVARAAENLVMGRPSS
jgi:hypothetical protein